MIQRNPNLTINELANILDNRIEKEAGKLNKIRTFEKRENVYNNLSALEWVGNTVRTVELEYRQ